MKHGSTSSLRSQIGSQLSEQQQVKAVQSDQRHKHQQVRFWPLYFGMLQGKRFGSNEEVISETEAYFEAKDKSFYKKGIELLEKHWNQCITLEEDYIDE